MLFVGDDSGVAPIPFFEGSPVFLSSNLKFPTSFADVDGRGRTWAFVAVNPLLFVRVNLVFVFGAENVFEGRSSFVYKVEAEFSCDALELVIDGRDVGNAHKWFLFFFTYLIAREKIFTQFVLMFVLNFVLMFVFIVVRVRV